MADNDVKNWTKGQEMDKIAVIGKLFVLPATQIGNEKHLQ